MRNTRSEGGVEKVIGAEDGDGNGDDEASDGNQFRPEGLKTGEGAPVVPVCGGAKAKAPALSVRSLRRRGEKTWHVNRQNKKKIMKPSRAAAKRHFFVVARLGAVARSASPTK
jgi:hypothetical protein